MRTDSCFSQQHEACQPPTAGKSTQFGVPALIGCVRRRWQGNFRGRLAGRFRAVKAGLLLAALLSLAAHRFRGAPSKPRFQGGTRSRCRRRLGRRRRSAARSPARVKRSSGPRSQCRRPSHCRLRRPAPASSRPLHHPIRPTSRATDRLSPRVLLLTADFGFLIAGCGLRATTLAIWPFFQKGNHEEENCDIRDRWCDRHVAGRHSQWAIAG